MRVVARQPDRAAARGPGRGSGHDRLPARHGRLADGSRRQRPARAHPRRASLRVAVGGRRRHDRRARRGRPAAPLLARRHVARRADPDRRHRRDRGHPRRDADARADLARRVEDRLRRGDRRRHHDAVDAGDRHRARVSRPGTGPGRASSRRRGSATGCWCSAATSPPRRPAPVALYTVGGGDGSHQPWFGDDGAAWATGFVRRDVARRDPDRGARGRRGRPERHAEPRRAAAVRRDRARRRGVVPLRAPARGRRHLRARRARRSRPTAPGSPGRRATASTSRRSARSTTAARSASAS